MVQISFLNPVDQPTGRRRLLADLRTAIQDPAIEQLRIIVAYAKAGPLLRLQSAIEARRAQGFRIEAIFGFDQLGTSSQALGFALQHFDDVYITQEPNLTFHPKIYILNGPGSAQVHVGSNNLTVGGTETNFEASLKLSLTLPDDAAVLNDFERAWTELLPATCPATRRLTAKLLDDLVQAGEIPDERVMRVGKGRPGVGGAAKPKTGLPTVPPSALPKKPAAKPVAGAVIAPLPPTNPNVAQGLAIQIKPHHNGEIFLSVTAALQNPAFFKWPFTGFAVPKFAGNPAYPQLSPDPKVNIAVFGAAAAPILVLNAYDLNTVYYQTKSEIRITASPLVGVVPDYSVMVMQQSSAPGIDYEITIYTPASPHYAPWVAACNQQMPGGGAQPRKFGWF